MTQFFLLMFLAMSFPGILLAENGSGKPVARTETIRVQGDRSADSELESPLPALIVNRQEIEQSIPEVATDALRGVHTVHLQTTTRGQGSPFLRGLTGSAVLNLVDGMRLNNAIMRSAPTPYLALVDSNIIDQFEVVRGPASVRHGSDAMGGVIQVITQTPLFDSAEASTRGLASAFFNSADLGRGLHVELESGKEGFGFRSGFSGVATSDLRGGGDTGIQSPTHFESFAGDFSALFQASQDETLQLDFQFLRQPKSPRYDELVAGFDQPEPDSVEFFYEPLERLFGHVRYERKDFHDLVERMRLDVAFQKIRDDRRTRAFDTPEEEIREHNSSELLGVTLVGWSPINQDFVLHWGADAYFDWVSSSRKQTDLTSGVVTWEIPRYPDGSTMNSYGVHTDVTWFILPSFELNAGIRYSYFDTTIAATPTLGIPERSFRDGDVTGGIGLTWIAAEGLEVLASFRRGFRVPNIFDIGTLGPRPGNRYNLPSEAIGPEILYTWDFGFSYDSDRFEAELFAYYSTYDNKIASVPTNSPHPAPDGRFYVQSRNESESVITGIEAATRIEIHPQLEIEAQAFWTWGEQRPPGEPLEPATRIPPLQGRLAVVYRPSGSSLSIESYLRFASRQDRLSAQDILDPRIDPTGTPGWVTLNIRSRWQWTEAVALEVELRNLTDENYREHGSGYQAPGVGVATWVQARF